MKPAKHFRATVEQQLPAQNEQAVLRVVGHVYGTNDECWAQAKSLTKFPVVTFQEIQNVSAEISA